MISPAPGKSIRIGAVTGHGSSAARYGVGGTDLGIARRLPSGRTAVVLGDTFEEMRVGGPGWRSPVILYTDDDTPAALDNGVEFSGAVGGDYARQLWDYHHDGHPWRNGGFSTVLPSDVIVIGSRMYLFVSVVRGLDEVVWTEIAYSDDEGETWHNGGPAATRPAMHEDGFQRGITWELGDDGWVYVLGSSWLINSGSNVRLWRVRPEDILDRGKWEPWGWDGRRWAWGNRATDIMPRGTKAREMNLRRVQGKYVFTFTEIAPVMGITCIVLDSMTSNMHTAPVSRVVRTVPWHTERTDPDNLAGQPYGGYIMPGSTLDCLYLLVSQWNTEAGWPYHTVLFAHSVSPEVARPEVTPEPEPDLSAAKRLYVLARTLLEMSNLDVSGIPARPDAPDDELLAATEAMLTSLTEL